GACGLSGTRCRRGRRERPPAATAPAREGPWSSSRYLRQSCRVAVPAARVVQVHLVEGLRAEFPLEPLGVALGDNAALVDDGELAGQLVRLVEVVRGEQDGHLVRRGEGADLVPHR